MSLSTQAPEATTPTPDRPTLSTTASVLLFGQLAWIGWTWAASLVLVPAGLVVAGFFDPDITESIWSGVGVGWQRWMLFGAGVVTATTYLRMFVTRGVTRRRLAHSAIVAMTALAAIGALVVVVGYVTERVVYGVNDWTQALDSGHTLQAGDLPRIGLEHALLFAAHFVAGWLVGAAYARFRAPNSIPLFPFCLLPVAAVELAVSRNTGALDISALPDPLENPAIVTSLGVGLVTLVLATMLATRVTRSLPVR